MIEMPAADQALLGRDEAIRIEALHQPLGQSLMPPFPSNMNQALFCMGCFWGAERLFWKQSGVFVTAVGYAGGYTPNPSYREVCSGMTGHSEAVLVVFDSKVITFTQLLKLFWEKHDPTQGMRQGNDIGTQYRSAIYTMDDSQQNIASHSRAAYGSELKAAGHGEITTEIAPLDAFYYAAVSATTTGFGDISPTLSNLTLLAAGAETSDQALDIIRSPVRLRI